jgi:hypothetical protein
MFRRLWILSLVSLVTTPLEARPVRRLFEPTDLELEDSGVIEADLQVGVVKGTNGNRIVVPDAEIDIGLTEQLELDLDGAFSIEDHKVSPDNLWVSLKAGLLSFEDASRKRSFSTGLQLGPKLPLARQAQGIGLEGLFLFGLALQDTHLIANIGGLLDPSIGGTSRPCGYEGGLSLDHDLTKVWNVSAQM